MACEILSKQMLLPALLLVQAEMNEWHRTLPDTNNITLKVKPIDFNRQGGRLPRISALREIRT